MKNTKAYILLAALCATTLFTACKPDPSFEPRAVVPNEEGISFAVPQGWPQPVYNFENNALTNEGFRLGRKLFYDPRLSRGNQVSCGSCHQASAAFAHGDHDLSHGVDDRLGVRNSPPIFNMNWHPSFFWDGGVNHIESQPINPIQNPVEMDETLDNILVKVRADAEYRQMFKAAWGDETINTQRIFRSIAQFMGAMVSANAKYDKYMRGETTLTTAEQNGLTVFNNNCATCHKAPLFTTFEFINNGLMPNTVNDSGRYLITINPDDMRKFKVPSLRNLGYTSPYMHDGRFRTLDAVLNHYATGIQQSPTLDPRLKDGIQLTEQERTDLKAFLTTLDDASFVSDRRFHEVR